MVVHDHIKILFDKRLLIYHQSSLFPAKVKTQNNSADKHDI